MYVPFTLNLPVPPRPLVTGEPVFVIDKNGWVIRPGCVTPGEVPEPGVRVEYRVPTEVEALFGAPAARTYRSLGTVGIEESVPIASILAMDAFVRPADVGDAMVAGTIVVLLRPEPFRVQLAQLESTVGQGDATNDVVSMRLLAPSSAGGSISAVGASMKVNRGTFVSVARLASELRTSFESNPVVPRYYLA